MGMSAAAMIVAGRALGSASVLPNAKLMIHQGSAGSRGAPADVQIAAREVAATTRQMAEIIARHTGHSVEQVLQDIDRDRFMTPEEAICLRSRRRGPCSSYVPGACRGEAARPPTTIAPGDHSRHSPPRCRRRGPLDEAIATYERLFAARVEHRARVLDQGVEAAAVLVGESRVELLSPPETTRPSAGSSPRRGPGIHHVAYEVEDIAAAVGELAAAGAELVDREPRPGLFGLEVAFVHPDSVHGVLTEVVAMADIEFVRVEIAFDGGQILAANVPPENADALERAVAATSQGTQARNRGRAHLGRAAAGAVREALRPRRQVGFGAS